MVRSGLARVRGRGGWLIGLAMVLVLAPSGGRATDHRDGPAVQGIGPDLADLYVFRSPANANNTVLIPYISGLPTRPPADLTRSGEQPGDVFRPR